MARMKLRHRLVELSPAKRVLFEALLEEEEALLEQVRQVSMDAYGHQDLPFEHLVDELEVERDLSRTPLFQVMFALQNVPMQELRLPDLRLTPLPMENPTAKFDLTLSLAAEGSRFSGTLEYNTDLFDGSTIRRMVSHYQRLLAAVVADPERRIPEVLPLGDAERQQMVVEWNDTGSELPQASVHELFEERAARTLRPSVPTRGT